MTFRRFVRLNASNRPFELDRRRQATNGFATRAFTLKKSLPTPAFRSMNSPFTIGRAGVPWIVVTPDVMLNGSAE